jgi:competence protein ComEA
MNVTRIGLAIALLVAAVAGVYALFRALDDRSAPPIVIEDAVATQPIVVDVRGAVQTPGVYELPPGARMQDAVAAAGGLADSADLSTVNLARRLRDAEVIVVAEIPSPGSTPAPNSAPNPNATDTAAQPARININTATAAELEALPGVGEVTAGRIIAFREENGPFRSVDDLIHIQGISAGMIDDFRPLVTTGP